MHCTVPEMIQNTYVMFYKSLQQFYNTALNESNNINMALFEVKFCLEMCNIMMQNPLAW